MKLSIVKSVLSSVVVIFLAACNTDHGPREQPLQIVDVTIHTDSQAAPRESHRLIMHFNRALTEQELSSARGHVTPRYTYGFTYEIETNSGHKIARKRTKDIMQYFIRDKGKAYLLTSESDHHPLRGFNSDVDKAFQPSNINSIKVRLFQQDKQDKDANYQLLQEVTFSQ